MTMLTVLIVTMRQKLIRKIGDVNFALTAVRD